MIPEEISVSHIQARNRIIEDRTILMKNMRRLGVYVAYFFLKLGLQPIHLTYLTFMLGLTACTLFATGKEEGRFIAMFLLVVWELFDTADGSMARALNQRSNYGGFIDYVSGMFLVAFLHLSIALGLTTHPEGATTFQPLHSMRPGILIFIAGLSTASALLYRLVLRFAEARFQQKLSDDQSLAKSSYPSLTLFLKELENFGGYQIPLLAICVILKSLTVFILGYCILESILLIGVSTRLFWGFRNFHHYPTTP